MSEEGTRNIGECMALKAGQGPGPSSIVNSEIHSTAACSNTRGIGEQHVHHGGPIGIAHHNPLNPDLRSAVNVNNHLLILRQSKNLVEVDGRGKIEPMDSETLDDRLTNRNLGGEGDERNFDRQRVTDVLAANPRRIGDGCHGRWSMVDGNLAVDGRCSVVE